MPLGTLSEAAIRELNKLEALLCDIAGGAKVKDTNILNYYKI